MPTPIQCLRRARLSRLAVAFLLSNACQAFSQEPFETVIDSPPTIIGNEESIGSNTQLNVRDGGAVGRHFSAGASDGSSTNVEVNISGGTVGDSFAAYGDTDVTISGGTVGDDFSVREGSQVTITGGTVGERLSIVSGSQGTITGGTIGNSFRTFEGSQAEKRRRSRRSRSE